MHCAVRSAWALSLLLIHACLAAETLDEFKVKREEIFEFTRAPEIAREGDKVAIRFAVKAPCDVTIAIEDGSKRIVRHLACGVLGGNAPEPFKKDTLEQQVIWDGKNDEGKYVEALEAHTVRVSLGLKPQFERTLFYSPKKRFGREPPIMQLTQEGVFVYDGGNARDFVRLFDHQGEYVRTVYPFPGDKIDQVKGLNRVTFPQDGLTLPVKPTFLQNTFLTCGNNYGYEMDTKYRVQAEALESSHYGMYGKAATFMAVGAGRVALGQQYLNRFATDGSSGGLNFEGPSPAFVTEGKGHSTRGSKVCVPPRSGAISPDGKTLYLTGYNFCHYGKASNDIVTSGAWDCFHAVTKMDLDGDAAPALFAGSEKLGKSGNDEKSFRVPISVATDAKGRVYVADYMNDRVQVFESSGKFARSLKVEKPARVCIGPNTQDLYVFSWLIHNIELVKKAETIPGELTRFSNLDQPKQSGNWKLPKGFGGGKTGYLYSGCGVTADGLVDTFTDPPTVWLVSEWTRENVLTKKRARLDNDGIRLFALEKDGLKDLRDFHAEAEKALKRTRPPEYGRQRLNVNPRSGLVYVAEADAAVGKSFQQLIELDPETGGVKLVDIPFDAEDLCFGPDGLAYLRTFSVVARFDPETWREVPWDYGSEFQKLHTSSSSDRKECEVVSGLHLPSNGGWHHGGMAVSVRHQLAVVCGYHYSSEDRAATEKVHTGTKYEPKLYPGRNMASRAGSTFVHVFNRRGQLVHEDAVPGLRDLYGIGIDADENLYLLNANTRMLGEKRYRNEWTGTLLKAVPGRTRLISVGQKGIPLPLAEGQEPKEKPDLATGGRTWVENKVWLYGGVGFCGKNSGIGCACHNTRFTLDYFNRSFAPEIERYRVAVLDSNGNLILRVGRYGNEDSSGPQSKVPLGGDEVGLFHGAYVATHTDRRLFIADEGNARILSVKLGYHASESRPVPAGTATAGKE